MVTSPVTWPWLEAELPAFWPLLPTSWLPSATCVVSATVVTWRATRGEALTARARARTEMIEKRILVVGVWEGDRIRIFF